MLGYFTKEIIFRDDFDSLNLNVWHVNNNGGSVQANGSLQLSSDTRQFPFVYLTNHSIPTEGDYYIKFSYEFPSTSFWGVGFGVGNLIPPYPITQTYFSTIDKDLVYFQTWQSLNDNFLIQTRHCTSNILCDSPRSNLSNLSPNTNKHILTIEYKGNDFYVTSDGVIIENSLLLNSGRRPTELWIGNSIMLDDPHSWTSINIDSVEIGRYKNSSVIVLPGFGGSWDLSAIMGGTAGNNWKVPPQITVYNGLLDALKSKGYTENTDLFLFPYDWRKPIDSLADDLRSFIMDNNLADSQVDLVGHSMGGLITRAYAQKYGTDKIDKIVTAGTPHFGLIDAYGLWEGTTFWGDIWWEKALLSLSTELNHRPGERKVDTLRRIAPSVRDLLPTTNYIYLNNLLRPWQGLRQPNLYLGGLNVNSTQIDTILTPLWTGDEQTRNTINAVKRSHFDSLMGLWEDGKPNEKNPFRFSLGDGTVTGISAIGPFTSKAIQGNGNHIAVISTDQNIQKILGVLGVSTDNISGSYVDYPSSVFIATIASPGRLEVCDMRLNICDTNLGLYYPDQKLFMLPGYSGQRLRVRVYQSGLEFGKYVLHLGNVDITDTWTEIEGRLWRSGQVDSYDVINGEPYPFRKDHCKKDGWRQYSFVKFKNEGSCVSYVESHDKEREE